MSNNSVTFSCSALAGVNKAGLLKKNANGYYPIVVGALNMYNSAGQYYVYEEAKELFESSSQFMRRVQKGVLRGENGHPKPLPGQTQEQFAQRCLSIYEENVSCHHKSITLDFDNVKDERGNSVIAIISEVCPAGPHGAALERSLNNPDENVCFSIRAFTDDFRRGGETIRVLKTIVTFDQVNEGGIIVAQKYKSPALESDSFSTQFSRGVIERSLAQGAMLGMAHESARMNVNELFTSMGWDKSHIKPSFAGW